MVEADRVDPAGVERCHGLVGVGEAFDLGVRQTLGQVAVGRRSERHAHADVRLVQVFPVLGDQTVLGQDALRVPQQGRGREVDGPLALLGRVQDEHDVDLAGLQACDAVAPGGLDRDHLHAKVLGDLLAHEHADAGPLARDGIPVVPRVARRHPDAQLPGLLDLLQRLRVGRGAGQQAQACQADKERRGEEPQSETGRSFVAPENVELKGKAQAAAF